MRDEQQVARRATDDGSEQVRRRRARQRGRGDEARALRKERDPRPEPVQGSLHVRAEHHGSDGVEPVGWRGGRGGDGGFDGPSDEGAESAFQRYERKRAMRNAQALASADGVAAELDALWLGPYVATVNPEN